MSIQSTEIFNDFVGLFNVVGCDPVVVIPTNIRDVESTRTYMASSRRSFFESVGCQNIHEVLFNLEICTDSCNNTVSGLSSLSRKIKINYIII